MDGQSASERKGGKRKESTERNEDTWKWTQEGGGEGKEGVCVLCGVNHGCWLMDGSRF